MLKTWLISYCELECVRWLRPRVIISGSISIWPSSLTTNEVKEIFRALLAVSQQVSFCVAGRFFSPEKNGYFC